MGSCYLMGMEFLFEMMEEVLEMDNGDGYTTMLMHLTLLNWTPYKWFKGHIYLMYILSHTHKYPTDSWVLFLESLTLCWSQRIYISNKFPSDTHAAGLETTLEETSPLKTSFSHPAREEIQKRIKKKLKVLDTWNSVLRRILESCPVSMEQSSRTG